MHILIKGPESATGVELKWIKQMILSEFKSPTKRHCCVLWLICYWGVAFVQAARWEWATGGHSCSWGEDMNDRKSEWIKKKPTTTKTFTHKGRVESTTSEWTIWHNSTSFNYTGKHCQKKTKNIFAGHCDVKLSFMVLWNKLSLFYNCWCWRTYNNELVRHYSWCWTITIMIR